MSWCSQLRNGVIHHCVALILTVLTAKISNSPLFYIVGVKCTLYELICWLSLRHVQAIEI